MLLEPVNMIDARLNPERLDPYGEEAELTFSNRKAILKIGTERMVSAFLAGGIRRLQSETKAIILLLPAFSPMKRGGAGCMTWSI